jgi:hypothetical protein
MASVLQRRVEALEQAMGTGLMVAVGWTCPRCGEIAELGDLECGQHRPVPKAERIILVSFVDPRA